MLRLMGASIVHNELEYGAEDPPLSPRLPLQNHHSQTAMHLTNSGIPVTSNSFGPATGGQTIRSGHSDQVKNSVFSNALSSPVRRSLQHYHLTQGGHSSNNVMSSGNGARNIENGYLHHQNRDSNTPSSNDSLMDMHADSPCHESPY
ncbi:unnamed protein product [Ilex paraguariensis]|uniref:Uncharacterized protein n=1 Tax=Ilex paraguariensis TaxID=185542 RepID=A0ABC8V4U2_9AQUA